MLNNSTLPKCWTDQKLQPLDVAIGIFLWFMTFVTFAPQILLLIIGRSNKGVDLYSALSNAITTMLTVFNTVCSFWKSFYCCTGVTPWQCFQLLIAFIQIFSVWLCVHAIYILAVMYWPESKSIEQIQETNRGKLIHRSLFSLYFIVTVIVYVLCILLNSFFYPTSYVYTITNGVIGILASITCAITWMPQIYTSYTLKTHGSLSVIMLLIQFPGTFLLIYFYIKEGASVLVWMSQVVSAFMTLIVLFLCFFLRISKRIETFLVRLGNAIFRIIYER